MLKVTGILLVLSTILNSIGDVEGMYKKIGRPRRPAAESIVIDTPEETLFFKFDKRGKINFVRQLPLNTTKNAPLVPMPEMNNMLHPVNGPIFLSTPSNETCVPEINTATTPYVLKNEANSDNSQISMGKIMSMPPRTLREKGIQDLGTLDEYLAWLDVFHRRSIDEVLKDFSGLPQPFPILDRSVGKLLNIGFDK